MTASRFKALVFAVTLCVLGGLAWTASYIWTSVDKEKTEIITIENGQTFFSIRNELVEKGWIKKPRVFTYWLKWKGELESFKAGTYELLPNMSPSEIASLLQSGVSVGVSVTIPEGYNLFQIGELLEKNRIVNKDDFIEQARSKEAAGKRLGENIRSFEGYLFPETYSLQEQMNAREVLEQMVSHFKRVWTEEWSERAKKIGLSQHETVTLASIIEKETGAPWERPLISSVFHNRLRKKIPLGTDPTIIYGLTLEGRYKGNLTRKHLVTKHPYNTRTFRGLPPSPISNPGKASLKAALFPEDSDYLFFVSKNDGTHVFTKNYEEHKKAVNKFQKTRSNQKGKSWRDLSKKLKKDQ